MSELIKELIKYISTHSPRAGRTGYDYNDVLKRGNFNSLAPCGANPYQYEITRAGKGFQLTRPVRGEPQLSQSSVCVEFISTHSPRAGRTSL